MATGAPRRNTSRWPDDKAPVPFGEMRSRGKLLLVSQSLGVPDYERAPGGPATVSGSPPVV
jgi:hypothetical protein